MFGPADLMNASRSAASNSTCKFTWGESPFTMTGLRLPTSRTSGFSVIMRSLDEESDGAFDKALEGGEQFGAERAVEDAVIARERCGHHAHEFDAIRRLHRGTAGCADRQDRRVRRIDDRRELADAVHAEIGDCRRAALIFVRLEFFLARAGGEFAHLGRHG